jgi:acetyltransferase-like isoleucine patch superfamily enzyme
MRLAERLYRSPFGRVLSATAHVLAKLQQPFMVYGWRDSASGVYRKWTRVSSNAIIMNQKQLSIGDHVWVWHHTILDATEGITIGEGTQIGAWVGIFTHGSESAVRLLGREFIHIPNTERQGYTRGAVQIGAYSFIGAGSVVLPGVTIGKGCLIGAGSLVTQDIPDFSVAIGAPAKVKGSTLDIDARLFRQQNYTQTYFDEEGLSIIQHKLLDR